MVTGDGAGTTAGALEVNVTVVGTRYGDPTSSVNLARVPAGTTGWATESAASSLRIVTVHVVVPSSGSSIVDAGARRMTKVLSGSGTEFPRMDAVTMPEVSPALRNGP